MAHGTVLVISSHVVSGAVGGRLALSVLEAMGHTVWFLPTVVLPWHPGIGPGHRTLPAPSDFAALAADLAGSERLAAVDAVLTGYFADAAQVEAAAGRVEAVRRRRPDAVHLCDPVIGDAGGLYVPPPVAAAIGDRLLSLADLATPNRHELAWLTGREPADNAALVAAARSLPPAAVAVTSAFAGEGRIANLLVDAKTVLTDEHEHCDGAPSGTGDLFAALLLGHRIGGIDPAEAFRRAAAGTFEAVKQAAAGGLDVLPVPGLA